MILIKFITLYFALTYSLVSLAEGIDYDSLLQCKEVEKVRCLEVQEFGHDFVGPQIDGDMVEAQAVNIAQPSIREFVCCEDDLKVRETIVGHIFDKMQPDEMIVALSAHKSLADMRGPASDNVVYNDDRFVGPVLPSK